LFALSFTQQHKYITPRFVALIFTIPIITILLAFTNSYHQLIWEQVDFFPGTNESVYHYGKWFWIYVAYEYGLVVSSIIILISGIFRFYNNYKNQVVFLIAGALIPLSASILYVFKLLPVNIDLTPVSLIFSGVIVGLGIYWQGMIDIMPIARKQIVRYLGDGIIVTDMADRIIDANPAILSILEFTQEELIGKSFELIKYNLFKKVRLADSIEGTIETIIRIGKEDRFFEIKINPVILSNQKLIGRIFILHDITKRKKALDAAVESNQLLRKEIAEKEKLIADLDAYARSVAHDLKNPISGLLGLRDIIKTDLESNNLEEISQLLEMAHEQAQKMYKIVDELLLLSRIRKEDIKPVPLEMTSIINEAIKRLNGHWIKSEGSIKMPESWPMVLGHAQWIEEVWYNFLSNAIKYGGEPPTITLGAEKTDGSQYRFWIQDNGNGLPAEVFDKIFNDFERLGRENVEGYGLGLPIVKRIIHKLGGEVQVCSDNLPGKGCVFSFTLQSAE
jgi:PAS domain S-box-containing protein